MAPWISPHEAAEALRTGTGRGVRIAVLDSGVEISHPQLRGVQWGEDIAVVESGFQLEVVAGGGNDLFGHGTAVAGIIHRLAPEAEIASFRVLGSSLEARTAIVQEGALLAIDRGYNILNCSFGCMITDHVLRYKHWVDRAYLRGAHVVAACSNSWSNRPEWPAFFTSAIAVNMARSEENGVLYHRPGSLVEFAAAGVDVDVPWSGEKTKRVIGSSFAAPHVTGLLARLLGAFPGLHPAEAKALLRRLALPWTPELLGPGQNASASTLIGS
jgi:subtilisin